MNFLNKIKSNDRIIVSTIVLKELFHKSGKNYRKIKNYFDENEIIKIIKTENEDYILARKFEQENNYEISFYDYLHIAICGRLNLILITRDKDLIEFAKNYVEVFKPEDLS